MEEIVCMESEFARQDAENATDEDICEDCGAVWDDWYYDTQCDDCREAGYEDEIKTKIARKDVS